MMSTHNLCFGSKVRKIGKTHFHYMKLGYKVVYITQTCFPDVQILYLYRYRVVGSA